MLLDPLLRRALDDLGRCRVTYDEMLRWASRPDEFTPKVQGISLTGAAARERLATQVVAPKARATRPTRPGIIRFGQ